MEVMYGSVVVYSPSSVSVVTGLVYQQSVMWHILFAMCHDV